MRKPEVEKRVKPANLTLLEPPPPDMQQLDMGTDNAVLVGLPSAQAAAVFRPQAFAAAAAAAVGSAGGRKLPFEVGSAAAERCGGAERCSGAQLDGAGGGAVGGGARAVRLGFAEHGSTDFGAAMDVTEYDWSNVSTE